MGNKSQKVQICQPSFNVLKKNPGAFLICFDVFKLQLNFQFFSFFCTVVQFSAYSAKSEEQLQTFIMGNIRSSTEQ